MKRYNLKKGTSFKYEEFMFVLLFGTLVYLFVSNMLYTYGITSTIFNAKYNTIIMVSLLFIAFYSLFFNIINNVKLPKVIWIATGFAFFSSISTLLNYGTQNQNVFISLTEQLFWWSICVVSFLAFKNKNRLKYTNRIVFVFFCIISTLYFQYATNMKNYSLLSANMINSIYYILLFIPFILMFKKSFLRNLCISIIIFATLLSLKRTAVLVLFASLIIYYFVNYIINDKKKVRRFYIILSLTAILLISIYAYNFILEKYNLDILLRLKSIEEDGGSGRNIIYQIVWNEIRKFDISYWVIGRGGNGVLLTSGIGLSAHNDFLEILYDYGVIGLSLYLILIFSIVKYNFTLIKAKSEYAGAYSASIVIFFIMSMTSHLILYPTYFMLLVSFWMWQIANVKLISEYDFAKNNC